MNYLNQVKILLLFFVSYFTFNNSFAAVSYESSSAELGVGFTDNVYQDDYNKVSDSYANLGAYFIFADLTDALSIRLLAQGYSKENRNNFFSYSLRYSMPWLNNSQKLTLSAGGLNYTNLQSGATDDAYDNFYLGAKSSKSIYQKNNFELLFDYGTKYTTFSKLNNRNDLQLFVNLNSDIEFNTDNKLTPFIELGFISSSQGYFSRNYLDVGVGYEHAFDQTLTLNADLYIRNSTYPNRKVSDILVTPRGNGRFTAVEVESLESTQQTDLLIGLTKEYEDISINGSIQNSTLVSKSELEKYTENQIFGSVMFYF